MVLKIGDNLSLTDPTLDYKCSAALENVYYTTQVLVRMFRLFPGYELQLTQFWSGHATLHHNSQMTLEQFHCHLVLKWCLPSLKQLEYTY